MSLFFNATMEEIMNKTAALLAALAAGAASSAALAQTSVTLHGIVDAGRIKVRAGYGIDNSDNAAPLADSSTPYGGVRPAPCTDA